MEVAEEYRRQAALLIRAIPLVAKETSFALKGGTAINLFLRDLPRLSVDIDLTYLSIADRGRDRTKGVCRLRPQPQPPHGRSPGSSASGCRAGIRARLCRNDGPTRHARRVVLDELYKTREEFIADLVGRMPGEHRKFLLSFEEGEPEWGLLDVPHAEQLPAIQWRLHNLAKIDKTKRDQLAEELRKALQL